MPGWSRKFGKASMLPMDGSKSNDGRSAVIQAENCTMPSLFMWETDASSPFTLSCSLQASCTPFAESAGASIFLGVKSVTPLSCVEISMLSSSKTWRVEQHADGGRTLLKEIKDRNLRNLSYSTVTLHVTSNALSLSSDGKEIFSGLAAPPGALSGPIGVGGINAKCAFRAWRSDRKSVV